MESDNHVPPPGRRYAVVMPSRNEERLIQQTLDCLARQTVRPSVCVIVDDGSTDRTGAIADEAARKSPWVRVVHRTDRGMRKLGGGVIEAFNEGLREVPFSEMDYVCKLDADITFQDGYFERLMELMDAEPRLGAVSGKVFNPTRSGRLLEEKITDEMCSGAAKFFRRQTFEDMGGFEQVLMWEGISYHRARMKGWRTCSVREEPLRLIHHRLMGSSHKSIYHGRLRHGRGQWFLGTHPLYIIASGLYRTHERPYVIGGLLIIAGYFVGLAKREPRYEDREFRRHLHNWQLRRIGLGWLAPRID